jgi:hypothetical protein
VVGLGSLKTDCVHHWMIEEPGGEYSQGVCKKCGIIREGFTNSHPSDKKLSKVDFIKRRGNGRLW